MNTQVLRGRDEAARETWPPPVPGPRTGKSRPARSALAVSGDEQRMNAADWLDLHRLRSERRLLVSANEHLHREIAEAQDQIRRLRADLDLTTAKFRRSLIALEHAEQNAPERVKPLLEANDALKVEVARLRAQLRMTPSMHQATTKPSRQKP